MSKINKLENAGVHTTIDLGQAIHALSDALDLVGVDEVGHGKRVGYMALECGHCLGLTPLELENLFYAGLLHDCGVSSTYMHRNLVSQLDWGGSEDHCIKGSELLEQFSPLAPLAPLVRYHHTRWGVLRHSYLAPEIARLANLIYLVDRVDALAAPHYEHNILLARHAVRDTIWRLSGSFFSPELVTLFLDLSDNEAFWLSLETRRLIRFICEREREEQLVPINLPKLKQLAFLFAQIVDAKSSCTMEHSLGTARLARFLAEQSGLPIDTCEKIEIAALLHDLGKLQIPDEILEKTGPLTREERALIERHSFETYQILRGIAGLEEISLWAACHHEMLNGQGYPFRWHGSKLTLEMRIIAVSDVFQALAQRRPYREPMTPLEILGSLRASVQQGHLDGSIVELAGRHLEACWGEATGLSVAAERVADWS